MTKIIDTRFTYGQLGVMLPKTYHALMEQKGLLLVDTE